MRSAAVPEVMLHRVPIETHEIVHDRGGEERVVPVLAVSRLFD